MITGGAGYIGFAVCEAIVSAGVKTAIIGIDKEAANDGLNESDREKIFYITNPASGLWAWKNRF